LIAPPRPSGALAGRYHRSGEHDDSYPHFRGLGKTQLLPSEKDYTRVFDRESGTFADHVLTDVHSLIDRCAQEPGTIIGGRISERIAARAVVNVDASCKLLWACSCTPARNQFRASG
jgi:hypothetical protein